MYARLLRRSSFPGALAIFLSLSGVFFDARPAGAAPEKAEDERLLSIEVREAEITDVLRALAQQIGLNIILGEGVEGRVSVSFKDVPFKDAMEMIIRAKGLSYTVQNNVFWVGKKGTIDLSDEMRTESIHLNNADPASAVTQLKGVLGPDGAAYADLRTNSVIIRDVPRNIERARQALKAIDTRTSQVLIEARIVEANSTFARQLGIQWGLTYAGSSNSVTGSQLLPSSAAGRNFAVNLPAANPTSGLGMVVGSISNKVTLDLQLSAAESKGDIKIVSSPKIATLNNRPATIHSGLTFRVKLSSTVVTGAATTTTSSAGGLETIKTGIDLTVTPQISSDGQVLLNISTTKSDPDFSRSVDGIPGVSEKSASTFVLAGDGDTVVIGGLYRTLDSEQRGGVPYLSKVPVIGALFRSETVDRQHEELLVFITPRIIKAQTNTEVMN